MSYKHFSIEERNCITYGLKNKESMRAIAKILNRSHTSVLREIRRNSVNEIYNPSKAEKLSIKRKKNSGVKLHLNKELSLEISKRLENKHSPEQIAGRLKKEKIVKKLSFKTIYNWIYKGLLPKISKQNLRRKGKTKSSTDNGVVPANV